MPTEQYKLGSSDYKEVGFSHFTTYASYQITIWLECRSACRYLHPQSSRSEQIQEESREEQKRDRHRGFL